MFKKLHLKSLALVPIAAAVILIASSLSAFADSEQYLVLGKDLTSNEQQTVLSLLGVKNMDDYNVSYITHQDEEDNLGNYLPQSVIGTRALSSALITKNPGGGITVSTKNINYCTEEMYQNALITAGVKDVDVKVAGPFKMSGTAALTATMKSYETMTGKKLDSDAKDAANDELVTTQNLSNEIGDKQKASDLVAALKQDVAGNDNYTREDGEKALNQLCDKENINLSDNTKNQLLDLMDKISKTDIDEGALKQQAKNIYDNIKGLGINTGGVLSELQQTFANIIYTIKGFFS